MKTGYQAYPGYVANGVKVNSSRVTGGRAFFVTYDQIRGLTVGWYHVCLYNNGNELYNVL